MTASNVFNRGTGLLIIEVRHSNPNGDPDRESDPRILDADGRGLISPVSFKRKLRDSLEDHENIIWEELKKAVVRDSKHEFDILEKRGRRRDEIAKMGADEFLNKYWDARIFGNTFLEDNKKDKEEKDKAEKEPKSAKKGKTNEQDHFISAGVVQFGPGVSISPVEIERLTTTNKSGVQEGKDRGMAPLGWRVVRHAVYAMPFFVNAARAKKNQCDSTDIDALKFLIPGAYRNFPSTIRTFVEIRHAWYAEHKMPLGSCPDSLILDALMPKRVKGESEKPSVSVDEYEIPAQLPGEVRERLANFEDLCLKVWG
ncbi:TPA: CRISPR-associated protein [Candidatus Sumerlaeota bacterium]|jgi:CRISPR-associated protein Csd2|nr:CRISPR-associated protein [Candidatus Sumerlaeota bacterium]